VSLDFGCVSWKFDSSLSLMTMRLVGVCLLSMLMVQRF
jgi:hypothetical protein